MVRKRKLPVVEVEWTDAHVKGGWRTREVYEKDRSMICHAVGYLLQDTPRRIVLLQQMNADADDVSDAVYIPRSLIIRRKRLA